MFHTSFVCVSFCLGYLLTHTFPQQTAQLSSSFTQPTTATIQYTYLNRIPLSYFLTPPRSKVFTFSKSKSLWLLILILLSGDIHLNPGPHSNLFNICSLNIRSLLKPVLIITLLLLILLNLVMFISSLLLKLLSLLQLLLLNLKILFHLDSSSSALLVLLFHLTNLRLLVVALLFLSVNLVSFSL